MSGVDDGFDDRTAEGTGKVLLAGRYEVVREIGRGAMGRVLLARDHLLDGATVALKLPDVLLRQDESAMRALRREASLARRLTHPHIVALRSVEESDGGLFLVMDYVEGRTLKQLLAERGPLPEEEVRTLFAPLAEALDYAHGEGVVHRDVKPANILIDGRGRARLADFGVARELADCATRATGRTASGTLPYMSPEQVRGEAAAPAQDVYGLAATIYECLAGHPPFFRGEIAWQVMNQPPPPLPGGTALAEAVRRGLSKDAAARPPTCRAILAEAPADVPVHAEAPPGAGPGGGEGVRAVLEAALSRGGFTAAPPCVRGTSRLLHARTGLGFVLVPAGSFEMGSTETAEERPVHRVMISAPFLLAETPCTWEAWERGGGRPSRHRSGPRHPVICEDWDSCREWCLSNGLRLPSEAEWEWTCRAGGTGRFSFGDDLARLPDFAWSCLNSPEGPRPVAEKEPNPWGFFDMHGNVFEWCEDAWHGNHLDAPGDGSARIEEGAPRRVRRGGAYNYEARHCRSAARGRYVRNGHAGNLGFRPAWGA
jgi:formylglycine-generating enzyme required for sulfatase activity